MAHQADYPISTMCRVLGVSTSGYYAWLKREPSAREKRDAQILEVVRSIHKKSRGTYGAPRIHRELREDHDIRVGKKRVARLMRQDGLRGVCRRKFVTTTRRNKRARPAPDLVERDFTAARPNQLWVADITYVPTGSGFYYLAVVLDVFSRRIVGWAMKSHMETSIVSDALSMAIRQRQPKKVIHHSDQGSQYTSIEFGRKCREAGVRPSMGSVGDCYDNAMCESFFATLECELIDRHDFANHAQARAAIFDFIEGWYNPHRRHSALDYQSPINYEEQPQRRQLADAV